MTFGANWMLTGGEVSFTGDVWSKNFKLVILNYAALYAFGHCHILQPPLQPWTSAETRTPRWAPKTDPQWRLRHLDGHWDKTTGTRWVLCTIWLLVHVARGELAPRLSLVSPKVFLPLACLVGDTSFPAIIVDLIAQIPFKAHGSHCAWLSSCFSVFVSFSVFFVCQARPISPGKNCWTLAEHTTISPTGFWLFECFAEHSSRRAAALFRRFRMHRRGKRAARSWSSDSTLPSIHLANLHSLPNKTVNLLLLSWFKQGLFKLCCSVFHGKPGWTAPFQTARYICLISSWSEQIAMRIQRGNRAAAGMLLLNERWVTYVTVFKEDVLFRSRIAFINCKPSTLRGSSARSFSWVSTFAHELSFTETSWSDHRHRTTTPRLGFNHSRGL